MASTKAPVTVASSGLKVCTRMLAHQLTQQTYYRNKIEAAEHEITKKTQNLRRLEAQRNALNTRGKLFHTSLS